MTETDLKTDNPLTGVARRWGQLVELSEGERNSILELPFSVRTLTRESYLVREGDKPAFCSLLVQGFAYRQKLVSSGARQIISFHMPGEFIDLQNGLLPEADHNVQALTRVELALVPKDAILAMTAASPGLRKAVWLDTLVDGSIFREWVVNIGRRDAVTKLAHLLCEFLMRMRRAGLTDGESCEFPLTQEQLADATGLTSVHTNRTLQTLRRMGVIELSAGKLVVLDWHRLCEVGDFSERYLHHG